MDSEYTSIPENSSFILFDLDSLIERVLISTAVVASTFGVLYYVEQAKKKEKEKVKVRVI